ATHRLGITYTFHAKDPAQLFGPDQYFFSLRLYTPPGARLTSSQGFTYTFAGPQQFGASDEPGRQMWGGFVTVADGIPYTLSLAWTVPRAATRDGAGHWRYALTYQHQAGSNQQLALAITLPGAKAPLVHYAGPLETDKQFAANF